MMIYLMIQVFSHSGENSDLEREKAQEAVKGFKLYGGYSISPALLSHKRNNSYYSWFSSSVMDFLCFLYNLVVLMVFLPDSSV